MKVIAENRQAHFEYFVEETYEAGILLDGGEVKSIKAGNVNLKDAYCSIYGGEIFIKGMHVSVYDKGGAYNRKDAVADRKLLLHKGEISKLTGKVQEKGYTLVPLKIYLKQSLIKIAIGLCKGKHTYDKKQTIKERELSRDAQREMKEYSVKK